MNVQIIRKAKLKQIIKEYGSAAEVARAIDSTPSYLSQIVSEKGKREVGHSLARRIELACNKPEGWMSKADNEQLGTGVNTVITGNVPLISWVAAGDWHDPVDTYYVGDAEEWLPCPPDCKQETTFVLGIEGDSMDDGSSNGYRDGEMIFVDGSRLEPKHNIDVVIKNGDGNATFKRLINSNGKWYLKPLNPQWPDKVIELDNGAHIIGTVLFSGKKRLA